MFNCDWKWNTPQDFLSHSLQTDTKWISSHMLKSISCIKENHKEIIICIDNNNNNTDFFIYFYFNPLAS